MKARKRTKPDRERREDSDVCQHCAVRGCTGECKRQARTRKRQSDAQRIADAGIVP